MRFVGHWGGDDVVWRFAPRSNSAYALHTPQGWCEKDCIAACGRVDAGYTQGMKMRIPLFLIALCSMFAFACTDETLDTTVYDVSCEVDDDCAAFTSKCLQADCQCEDFVANIDEADAIADDREALMCTAPKQGIQCDCAALAPICVEGECTAQ